MSGISGPGPRASTSQRGVVLEAADVGDLTDNTGGTPSGTDTLEIVNNAAGSVLTAPTATSAGVGASTIATTAVATTASVNTALQALNDRIDGLPDLTTVNAAILAVKNDLATLAAQVDQIRSVMRTAGQMA